ncbi:MAG: hypothetical protein L0Y32_00815 [Nevskiales bacterium]|nr:hypothetical protein [Nevskiales bacterium]
MPHTTTRPYRPGEASQALALGLVLLIPGISCTAAPPDGLYKPAAGPLAVESVPRVSLQDTKRGKEVQMRVTFPREGGPYPLILYSHYSGGNKDGYVPLVRHWVGHGYVVIQPNHSDSPQVGGQRGAQARGDFPNRPLDMSFILDSLDAIEKDVPTLKGKIDRARIAAGGHYIGGGTAEWLGGLTREFGQEKHMSRKDARIQAVLTMSPTGTGQGVTQDSWQGITIPMLVMTGTEDKSTRTQNPPEWRTEPFLYAPKGEKYLAVIEGGGGRYGGAAEEGAVEDLKDADRAVADLTLSLTLAFWDAYLKADAQALKALQSGAIARDGKKKVDFRSK